MGRANKTPRRAVDDGEQQDIDGTRVYNAKIEKKAKAYVEALGQRQSWQADENNLRGPALEIMESEGIDVYYLKTGHKVENISKGSRLKVTNPKDEDGKADKPERQGHLESIE